MALIAQAEMEGIPFRRNFHLNRGAESVGVAQQRRVRIGALLNDKTGDMSFHPVKELPSGFESTPHIPLDGRIFDSEQCEGPSLSTVRKRGASTPSIDTEAVFVERGATLEPLPKTGGFGLSATRKEIEKERERKKIEVTYGQEAAAILTSKRNSPPKKGGFAFTSTPREIARERKRKKALARQIATQIENENIEFP